MCGAGADPGGPSPALRAGLQPNGARVEAGLRAAGLVCRPQTQVRAGVPGSHGGWRLTRRAAWATQAKGRPVSGHRHHPTPPRHRSPASEVKASDTALGVWPPGRLFPDHTSLLSGRLGPLRVGQDPVGRGPLKGRGDSTGEEGTLQGEVLTTQEGEKRGAQPAEVLAGGFCCYLTPSLCETFAAQDFISQSNGGVPLPASLLFIDSGSGICLVAKLGVWGGD